MSVSSTQPKKEHFYCLMARVATPATPLVASSGIPTLQLPFGGYDGDCGVTLVEDEAGTEFKFSDFMPDTIDHSGSIGNLAAIGDRDRVNVDRANLKHLVLPTSITNHRTRKSRFFCHRCCGVQPCETLVQEAPSWRKRTPRLPRRPWLVSWIIIILISPPLTDRCFRRPACSTHSNLP